MLGGRGVQDVLFEPGAPAHRYGTSLRCHDPAEDVWHVAWMAPAWGQFARLVGRRSPDGIVQEGTESGVQIRWTFTEIEPDSFHWQGFESGDGGTTWRLAQRMRARRRAH